MSDLPELLQALDFAAVRHSAQRRKGPDAAPYVNHLIEVACLLANVGGVRDVEVLMAAVLHDVLEDTATTAAEVEERFGGRVLGMVAQLSDDKSLPSPVARQLTLDHLPTYDELVKTIKLADLTSNIKRLPDGWSLERKRAYLKWSRAAAAICGSACPALARLYEERARATAAAL